MGTSNIPLIRLWASRLFPRFFSLNHRNMMPPFWQPRRFPWRRLDRRSVQALVSSTAREVGRHPRGRCGVRFRKLRPLSRSISRYVLPRRRNPRPAYSHLWESISTSHAPVFRRVTHQMFGADSCLLVTNVRRFCGVLGFSAPRRCARACDAPH